MYDAYRTYQNLKSQYPKSVLLIQVDRDYVAFEADALVLDVVCGCSRQQDFGDQVAGSHVTLSRHSLQRHIAKLLEAGYMVTVADLIKEAPKDAEIERITMPAETPHPYYVEPDGDILWARNVTPKRSRHKA